MKEYNKRPPPRIRSLTNEYIREFNSPTSYCLIPLQNPAAPTSAYVGRVLFINYFVNIVLLTYRNRVHRHKPKCSVNAIGFVAIACAARTNQFDMQNSVSIGNFV